MQSFGRYQLDHRIGIGGMGEVFAGRMTGAEGFERPVAIKVILPELSDDVEFQRMFVDEAKISMFLSHANVVQVLDLGDLHGRWYLAMEYVEGPSLARVSKLLAKRGQMLSVPLACYVLVELLKGLDYAHKARDRAGQPLGIVHRDVTPQNVLLSMQGEVKLSDFGIARASTRRQRTETGIVRGKLFYLAPEQFEAGPSVGPWTDVYAAGMVLLTLLLGKSPLEGQNEAQVVDRLKAMSPVPLDGGGGRIPAGLLGVVERALAPNFRKRFTSAQQFQDALEEFLLANQIKTGSRYLAEFLHTLAADEARARGLPVPEAPTEGPTVATPSQPVGAPGSAKQVTDAEKSRSLSLALVMGTIDDPGMAGAPGTAMPLGPVPTPLPMGATPLPITALPAPGSRAWLAPALASGAILIAAAAGFGGGKLARPSVPLPPVAARAGTLSPAADVGYLFFDPYPWVDCTIDGSPVGATPLVGHPLPPGSHVIEWRSVDGSTGRRDFEVRAGKPTVIR